MSSKLEKPPIYITPGGAKRRRESNAPTFVYWLFDRFEEAVYIGIAFDLEVRFNTHASEALYWWYEVERFEARLYPTRQEAHAAESSEIRRLKPRNNVAVNRGGRVRPPYPQAFLRPRLGAARAPVVLEGTFGGPLTKSQRRDPTRDTRIPDLVSVAQAAEILGKTPAEVMELVDHGWLHGACVDSVWVFRRDAVLHRLPKISAAE